MTTPNRLTEVADQIIRTISQLPDSDPRSRIVAQHLDSLVKALRPGVLKTNPPPPPNEEKTLPATPTSKAPTARPSQTPQFKSERPGLLTNRRALRRAAGVTLKQVAKAAETTLPTARMYEVKRTAVREDKRKQLDEVYKSFERQTAK